MAETNDEKSIRVIEAKIIFYSSSKQRFLTKKRQRIEFFAGFGAIDGMKLTVPVHVFNFILFFSNRRRGEGKNSVRRISTIHSKQQEKTYCDVEDNKNTLSVYAHTYTNFASRYLRKHMWAMPGLGSQIPPHRISPSSSSHSRVPALASYTIWHQHTQRRTHLTKWQVETLP